MRLADLPVFVHQQIGAIAVQHARTAARYGRRMQAAGEPVAGRFDAEDFHGGIVEEGMKKSHRVGAATDVERQQPNVFRMKLLGAEVMPVTSGAATLKDAMNEALRHWVANVHDTYYCIGTVAGPHPYPVMVRDFQSVIGEEARAQMQAAEGRLPDALVAAIGGGSNAMGLFFPFLDDPSVRMYGVEAAGRGVDTEEHAASLTKGRPGVLHGNRTYLLQDAHGQITEAHSISAGLDYPGVGPEHSWLHELGRVDYVSATDDEALAAFQLCSRLEGIIPALEPAHALAHVVRLAPTMPKDGIVLMNLCGRGDKDIFTVARHLGVEM